MAEEGSDSQEKTEDPSQRKIDKSLEEGKVLKSQEVNIFTSMAAGLLLMFAVPSFVNKGLAIWGSLFRFGPSSDLNQIAFANIMVFLEILVTIGVVLGIPLAIVAILTQRAISGHFIFAPKASITIICKSIGLLPIAQPPGSGTFADPLEANKGPKIRIEALICLTSSYKASSFLGLP